MFPELAIAFKVLGDVFEGLGLEAAGTPLGVAGAGDEAGVLKDFQVLGDCGESHLERGGEVGDGGFAAGEAGEDGAARGIGEGGEGGVELGGGGLHYTEWLIS